MSLQITSNVTYKRVLLLAISLLVLQNIVLAALPDAAKLNPKVKNVIILIGDGMGFNTVLTGDYFDKGEAGQQVYQQFPVKFACSTWSLGGNYNTELAWGNFDWLKQGATDSAAAATALSCGQKTYNAALCYIGNSADTAKQVKNLLEDAEELGKSTGVVTSVQWSHATPAGFAAHNKSRNAYQEIASEMINKSLLEVIMGCGNPLYNTNGVLRNENPNVEVKLDYKYVGGEATWQALLAGTAGNGVDADHDGDSTNDTWTLLQSRELFQKLMTGKTPKRVCGTAQVDSTLQQARSGNDKNTVNFNDMITTVPTLQEMSLGAINVLDNNPRGFCLMIEGGAIDWAAHANEAGRLIEEQLLFNRTVEAVHAWVEANSNWDETLLIVTSDHETGYVTGPGANPLWPELVNNGAGKMPGFKFNSGEHTNSLVPFYAKGASAQDFIARAINNDKVLGKYIDNTDVWKVIHTNYRNGQPD